MIATFSTYSHKGYSQFGYKQKFLEKQEHCKLLRVREIPRFLSSLLNFLLSPLFFLISFSCRESHVSFFLLSPLFFLISFSCRESHVSFTWLGILFRKICFNDQTKKKNEWEKKKNNSVCKERTTIKPNKSVPYHMTKTLQPNWVASCQQMRQKSSEPALFVVVTNNKAKQSRPKMCTLTLWQVMKENCNWN